MCSVSPPPSVLRTRQLGVASPTCPRTGRCSSASPCRRTSGSGYEEALAFVAKPLNAAFLILLVITLLYHAVLGLQVVIEDYVHNRAVEVLLYFITRAGAFLGMAVGVIFILKLALGG